MEETMLQSDIVPLPIELPIETQSESLKEEADDTNEGSPQPPPLPITADNEMNNEAIYPDPPSPPKYSPYSPPQFHNPLTPAHLRAPPPLTPMDKIATDGTVIGGRNNEYIMAPPQLPNANTNTNVAPSIEYNCHLCRIAFNTKSDLLIHRRNIHPRPPEYVGYGDSNVVNDAHSNEMERKLRFYCNICGRNFSGKQHYQYHMRTHSGEKPFTCQTCGKAFRAKHSLKNHIRIHTGERPYQCKVCGKWFRQLGVMKNHIRKMHALTK